MNNIKKLNKKGVTLVELIVSFMLVAVAIIYFYQTLYTVKKLYTESQKETNEFVEINYAYRLFDSYIDVYFSTTDENNVNVTKFCNDAKKVPALAPYLKFDDNTCLKVDGKSVIVKFKVNDKVYTLYKYLSNGKIEKTINDLLSNENNLVDKGNPNKVMFTGSDPNNYIKIGNNIYRIIGKEDEKIKIIDYDFNGTSKWDTPGRRYNNNNTFCKSNANQTGTLLFPNHRYNNLYGCNVFMKINGNLNRTVRHNAEKPNVQGTVNDNSTMYEKLQEYYENNVLKNEVLKNIIIKDSKWNTGMVKWSYGSAEINNIQNNEESETSVSTIGLLNVSDYIYASLNQCNLTTFLQTDDTIGSKCANNNWLYNGGKNEWTINADDGNTWYVWSIFENGKLQSTVASDSKLYRPVFYISGDTKLGSGNGSKDDPYVILSSN